MDTTLVWIAVLVAVVLGPVIVSHLVERLRPEPPVPDTLGWASAVPIRYLDVEGYRLRYVTTGTGPPLVLLHTLRTQLDLFQKVLPELGRHFTVFALDYPGHGYSDIPRATYAPDLFVGAVSGFLERLDITGATVAGVSIGGSIPLIMAARRNPRVARVVSINPYDYAGGTGVRRSSAVASLVFGLARIPVVGDTVMRLRNRMVENRIFDGGVRDPTAIPPALREEMFLVGTRPGHYRAFLNLIRHADGWERAREEYPRITVPVLLVYGERDWSLPAERDANLRQIPGARMETVEGGGHFLVLDAPEPVTALIIGFAGGRS